MAVEIIYQKQKPVEAVKVAAEVAQKVDRVAELDEYFRMQAKADEAKLAEFKSLKKELLEYADETYPAEEEAAIEGFDNIFKAGPKPNAVTAMDKQQALVALGTDTFLELATLKVGDIRKYCTPPQVEEILTEERVGTRRVKITKK